MHTFKTLLFIVAGFFLVSCNNKPAQDVSATEEHLTESEAADEDDHADISGEIELENGQKWVVNEEMKPFIIKGEELVNTYVADKGSDYAQLAKNLVLENGKLIKSCTMQGKSHEELHKWLNPHMLLVEDLEDAQNPDEANEVVQKLIASFKLYHQYFN